MKHITIILMVLLCATIIYAQVPEDVDTATSRKISQEHQNTRKFVSDELTRRQDDFYKQMDSRATYYENEAEKLLTTTTWKLGLIWAGVVLLITGFFSFLSIKLEKRRYKQYKRFLAEAGGLPLEPPMSQKKPVRASFLKRKEKPLAVPVQSPPPKPEPTPEKIEWEISYGS